MAPVRGGTISGTPAYMAPSRRAARSWTPGPTCSPRAWCWRRWSRPAGCANRGGARSGLARRARRPPRAGRHAVGAGPPQGGGRRREQRYSTAAALSRALDEVTLRTSRRRVAAAVSRPGLVHREGRGVLRRPRARDRGDVEEAAAAASARADRSVGRGQELVPARRARAERAARLAASSSRRPGNRPFAALAHALAPELAGDAEAVARLIDFEQPGVAVDVVVPLAPPARSCAAGPRSVRGAVHAESAGRAGAVRAAARPAGARRRRPRAAVDARRLPVSLPQASRAWRRSSRS